MLQTFHVPAGGRQVDAKASFFRYETAGVDGVDQSLRVRADGNDLGTYLPGDNVRLPIEATRWELTPVAPTQTCNVRLGVGSIETARLAGIVTITNRIGAAVQQLEASGGALLPINFLATLVVAAASNVRGLLVRRAVVFATAGVGGTSEIRLIAAPSVPLSSVPVNAYQMAGAAGAAGVFVSDTHADQNYQLPAGWGVWCVTQHTGAAAAGAGYTFVYEPL